MDKVGLELTVFFCLLPLTFWGYRSLFGFKVSAAQPDRPDERQTFGEFLLCSGALGGVAVSGWGWGGFTFVEVP